MIPLLITRLEGLMLFHSDQHKCVLETPGAILLKPHGFRLLPKCVDINDVH